MKVTQEHIKNLIPGQTLMMKCDDAPEWESTKRVAQKVKKGHIREDGYVYRVTQNVRELTVAVTLEKGGNG